MEFIDDDKAKLAENALKDYMKLQSNNKDMDFRKSGELSVIKRNKNYIFYSDNSFPIIPDEKSYEEYIKNDNLLKNMRELSKMAGSGSQTIKQQVKEGLERKKASYDTSFKANNDFKEFKNHVLSLIGVKL